MNNSWSPALLPISCYGFHVVASRSRGKLSSENFEYISKDSAGQKRHENVVQRVVVGYGVILISFAQSHRTLESRKFLYLM